MKSPVEAERRQVWMIGGALATLVLFALAVERGVSTSVFVALVLVSLGLLVVVPEAAAPAMFMAIPVVFHPLEVSGQRFSALELCLVLGTIAISLRIGASALRHHSSIPVKQLLLPLDLTLLALSFSIVGALSLLTLADRDHIGESMRQFRVAIFEPCCAIVLVRYSANRGVRAPIIAVLLATGVIVSGWAVGELLLDNSIIDADGVARARGPYPHPNNLALYLDRVAIFGLGLLVCLPTYRRFLVPVVVALATGLAVTLSRGALLAVIAGSGTIVALALPRRSWTVWVGAAIGLISFFFLAARDRLLDRGLATGGPSRLAIWRSSLRMAKDHPYTGVGPDQFLYQYGRRYVEPGAWAERYTSHPHNVFLDFWLTLGLVGLVLLGATIAVSARTVRRAMSTRFPADRAVSVAVAGSLAAGLAHGLVDNSMFQPDLAVLTWGMLAMISFVPRRATTR